MVNIWSFFAQASGSACPLCNQAGEGFCAECAAALPYNHRGCEQCAVPLPPGSPIGALCSECQQQPPAFDRIVAPLRYQTPASDLIAQFKYHARLDLGPLLANVLTDAVRRTDPPRPQLLLPVPMHAAGLRRRGFNQAAEITRIVARDTGIAWRADLLKRRHQTSQQRGSTRAQRRRNLRHAFHCEGDLPQHVALVDDVVTTGATANEICRALKDAGVARVEVWAIARTPQARSSANTGSMPAKRHDDTSD